MRTFGFSITISVIIVFMVWTGAAIADIGWDFGDYTFQVYQQPQASEDEEKIMPFITASLEKTPEGETTDEFGIVFKAKEGETFWVYEIYDVEADKLVKQITLNEMLGLTKDQGCELISNEQPDNETLITSYRINTGGYDLKLTRIIKLIADPNLPKGNRIVMTFELMNRLSGALKLRFTERHQSDDYAFAENGNAVYTVNKQAGHDGWPILVQAYTPELASLSTDGVPEEKNFTVSTATWQPVVVQSAKTNRPNVEIGQLTLAVATSQKVSFVLEQARNIADYLTTGNSNPQLSVVVEVDKKEAYPGEVLTYQLICLNIGTGKAVDGSILDPLPSRIEYLPDSASGERTQITYSIDGGNTFQPQPEGNVTHIKWDVVEPINAGELIQASFQAKVLEK